MAENITISGAGNVDGKNFYVDPNGDLYYNVLFERIPSKAGDFTTAGKPLEAKRWPSGETVLNLNGFNFTRSNYNPLTAATPASANAVGNTTTPPTVTTRPTGVLPPPSNTAVPGLPENATTYEFTADNIDSIPVELAPSYNPTLALRSFNTGSAPVTVAMPGSSIIANYDANPALGNVTAQPGTATPVFAPTRAQEFNPTTGGIEVGPAAQVKLATDGTMRITPDTATEVQLGSGVQQAANGDYVVSNGGVAVLPPNTEVVMEPGSSATLMPFTAGNTESVVLEAGSNEVNTPKITPPINSSATQVANEKLGYVQDSKVVAGQEAEEYLGNPVDANLETNGLITDGRLPGAATNAQTANIDQLALAEDAALPGNGIGTGAGNLQTGIGAEVYASNKEEPIAPESAVTSDPNVARGTDGASPIPKEFLEKIIAKPNPFKGFATMTYSVSLYMLDKPALERIYNQGVKSVAGLPLLIQSGGAANVGVQGTYGAIRDENFHLDFYLDDIEIKGLVSGTSTQSVHNTFEMSFSVSEPNGLTFLDSLHKAVKDFKVKKGFPADKINYAAQNYLMVIRFYGYDEFGKIVDGATVSKTEPTSDQRAVSEKFIPFIFTGITFSVTDAMIQYQCTCATPQSFYSQIGTHGTLPFNIELQGGTVGDILGEGKGYDFEPAQNNRKSTVYNGLAEALNTESEIAYGSEFANKYIIEFEEGSEIADKKVVVDLFVDKNQSAMPSDTTAPSSPNTDRVNKGQGRKSLPAGTSIIQAIELVVRESEFVKLQQNIIVDKRTGKPIPKEGASKVFQWFKVVTNVVPRSDKINPQTMDYAYTITYTIKRYAVGDAKSPYFPGAYYRGVHKRYPYWFTGENTEVIDFRQEFNYLYYQQFGPERLTNPVEINTIHVTKNYYLPRSNESSLGGVNKSSEATASVASILYSPADMASAELTIVGDPDWIAQSEIFYSPKISKQQQTSNTPFLPDGSVNYDASEIYFSVEYNTPADYQDTGLQNIGYDNPNKGVVDISGATATVVLAYRANEITTMLKNGMFTQHLKGTLMTWRDDKQAERQADGSIAITVDTNARKPQNTQSQMLTDLDIDLLDTTAEKYSVTAGSDQAALLASQEREFYEEDSNVSVVNTQPIASASGDITDVEFEQAFDEQELQLLDSTAPPITPTPSTNPTPLQPTVPADPAQDVIVNGTTQPQAEPEFENPVPPPLPARPEPVNNTANAQSDGQGNYVYNDVEFSANTQAAYDNYINSINSNRPSIIEDYDPFYGAKVQRRVSVARSGAVVDKILGAYDINGNLVSFADGNSPAQNKALLDYTNDKIKQDRNPDPFRDL